MVPTSKKAEKRPLEEHTLNADTQSNKPPKKKALCQPTCIFEPADPTAQYNYAEYHLIIGNESLAKEWFLKAASNDNPKALFAVGSYYLKGVLFEKNPERGIACLKIAAIKFGMSIAQHVLGLHYLEEKKYAAARFWLDLAASNHLPLAVNAIRGLDNLTSLMDSFNRLIENIDDQPSPQNTTPRP